MKEASNDKQLFEPIQQSFDFEDYSKEEQERDRKASESKQLQPKQLDVYIIKFRGQYGAFLPQPRYQISVTNEAQDGFSEFVNEVEKIFNKLDIKPRFRCVLNEGIEKYLAKVYNINNLLRSDNNGR